MPGWKTSTARCPAEMIDRRQLLDDLKPLVRLLEDDLRGRLASLTDFRSMLDADWRAARAAGRTAGDFTTWADAQFTQAAVAWILACCFVRFCEDNGLIEEPLIAGTDGRGQRAAARQEAFYGRHPIASDNDYLRDVFAAAGQLPGLADVFRVQAPYLAAPVSADAAKRLVAFFRSRDADSGTLKHDFADPEWNTRFLGDLYQDLSEAARLRYALLQTPEFVEEFILDRTLTPALDTYALDEVDVIDPTCGSGHFLLGAFARLAPLWLAREPGNINIAIQHALDRIAGIDLNPYAVSIARFRLLVAALKLAGVKKLKIAPDFHLRIAVGDSLLHGFDQRDHLRAQRSLGLELPQQDTPLSPRERGAGGEGGVATRTEELAHLYNHAFASEDLRAANDILSHHYAVVVGNPPYITVKDRAVSVLYRERYASCSGKYALVAPFCERFWALGKQVDATQRGGYIGLIVANSFMKREFGKKLVEAFFPAHDLTHVIDTSGAYIPGHGTPTAILLGRSRPPAAGVVRAVMGIKGEPATPAEPAQGVVWQAILNQIDVRDSESEWVSVSDVQRSTFAKHPWSIGGGGAAELKEAIEARTDICLSALMLESGFFGISAADDIYILPPEVPERIGLPLGTYRPVVSGDEVRDWIETPTQVVVFPYKESGLIPLSGRDGLYRFLWPYRQVLGSRSTFSKTTYFEEGRPWWEWHQIALRRLSTPLTITYGEVTTHNHFVLDRGGKVFNRTAPIIKLPGTTTRHEGGGNVFKQTAPVIKLPGDASEDEHLGLLSLLNSSTACFWFKQVCFPKGGDHVGNEGARVRRSLWDERFAHDGTKVGQFPVVAEQPVEIARTIDHLARDRSAHLPKTLFAHSVSTRTDLDEGRAIAESLRRRMIAWQEELDWRVYRLYDILDDDLTFASEPPEIGFGERAFEILLAREIAAGRASTTWFERHGAEPITELPSHWPSAYRELVERRMTAIQRNHNLALIERPECKRRWSTTPWAELERTALESWLLDRLEDPDLWPRDASPAPQLLSSRDLAEVLSHDEEFRRALDLYAGAGSDAGATIAALLQASSVPFLDVLRYSETGTRKRAVWLATWESQRREDGVDAAVARELAGRPAEEIAAEQKRRKAAEVGSIPVPPKYRPEDFRDGAFWKLRGALDVPKERFVSFPGLERSRDAGLPLVLWAGYDAKARALALTIHIYDLQQREGADAARLAPALAGLDELLPWVHQWHPEVDPDLGTSTGEYLKGLLDAQLAQHGFTLAGVRAWAPPATQRLRRHRSR